MNQLDTKPDKVFQIVKTLDPLDHIVVELKFGQILKLPQVLNPQYV